MAENQPNAADTHAFLRLYTKNQLKIHTFLQMLLPDPGEAEEVMQQTSILLWETWAKYDQNRDFLPWACGVAKYQAYRHLRTKKKGMVHLSEALLEKIAERTIQSDLMQSKYDENREALDECLRSLPQTDQQLLQDRYRAEMNLKEIAERRGRAPSTVCESLAKLRSRLLDCIRRRLSLAEGISNG